MTGHATTQASSRIEQSYAYPRGMQWTPDKIRREREARGLSQTALAHLLSEAQPDNSVSRRSVTAWENNEATPAGRNLAALDKVLAPPTDTPDGPTLASATLLQLLDELMQRLRQLGAGETGAAGLPDRDVHLPRRNGSTQRESGTHG